VRFEELYRSCLTVLGTKRRLDRIPRVHTYGASNHAGTSAIETSVPPTAVLASVAATLAAGSRITPEAAASLVGEALLLWDAANSVVQDRSPKTLKQKAKAARIADAAELRVEFGLHSTGVGSDLVTDGTQYWPKEFPASPKDFFRLVVRRRTRTENTATFREFLRFHLRNIAASHRGEDFNCIPVPSNDEIAESLAGFSKLKFDQFPWDFYAVEFLKFKRWLTKARGQKGANGLHSKRRFLEN
jgi:hypothetical protein